MNTQVKICGLSTPATVELAATGGATHIGFIFFPKSPRYVTPQAAAELAAKSNGATTVAVTVDATDAFLDEIVATLNPDILQLHGSETPERVSEVKQRYGKPVMKALAIRQAEDVAKVSSYETSADMLLLDAKPPEGSDLPGGNGVSFDWSLIAGLTSKAPILLSGGIDINNVGTALEYVADGANDITGIDVSSGVESTPGVKDPAKIETFLDACRQRHS